MVKVGPAQAEANDNVQLQIWKESHTNNNLKGYLTLTTFLAEPHKSLSLSTHHASISEKKKRRGGNMIHLG